MNTEKIRPVVLGMMFCAATAFGLSACDKGTKPGEVNVERSDIREEGSIIDEEEIGERGTEPNAAERYDHHYDHIDDPDSVAIGDGAYEQH